MTPYIGEIRMFGGNFAPIGWALCNGQLISIASNDALFSLIGTTYGGDGVNTFALPNLQGRLPIHQGNGGGGVYVMGQLSGTETVTLTGGQIPTHSHSANVSTTASSPSPANAQLATAASSVYVAPVSPPPAIVTLAPQSVAANSGGQSHSNLMPFQVATFIISLEGIYPTQS